MNSKKILITGSSGFVGSEFIRLSAGRRINLLTPGHQELDTTKKQAVLDYLARHLPRVVINFAAMVNVGESEKERGNKNGPTWQTNVAGVRNLVQACQRINSFFIQISTDAVFPGSPEFPGPYSEDTAPPQNPEKLSWYGLSKLGAEKIVQSSLKNWAIIRISLPFGNPENPKDSVAKTIKGIKAGYSVFTDQIITPTFIPDLAGAIWKISNSQATGIFHVACQEPIPRIEFARYIARAVGLRKELKEGTATDFLKTPGQVPISILGGLSTKKTQERLKLKFHGWQEALNSLNLRIELFPG